MPITCSNVRSTGVVSNGRGGCTHVSTPAAVEVRLSHGGERRTLHVNVCACKQQCQLGAKAKSGYSKVLTSLVVLGFEFLASLRQILAQYLADGMRHADVTDTA